MSVSLPQFKTRKLTPGDFVANTIDGGYDANGVVLGSVAQFYNVSDDEKNILFQLNDGFHKAAFNLANNKISIEDYLKQISELNELAQDYQTAEQLREQLNQVKKPTILALYAIEWEEREKGWGTRPDGFTIHRSLEESEQYVKDFFANQPEKTPDEYSRPLGSARLIEVSESLHDYVVAHGSVWLAPHDEKAYKTYDASHLKKPKKKM